MRFEFKIKSEFVVVIGQPVKIILNSNQKFHLVKRADGQPKSKIDYHLCHSVKVCARVPANLIRYHEMRGRCKQISRASVGNLKQMNLAQHKQAVPDTIATIPLKRAPRHKQAIPDIQSEHKQPET